MKQAWEGHKQIGEQKQGFFSRSLVKLLVGRI